MEKKCDNHSTDQPEFEFNQIDEQVYIGTNACCALHFDEQLLQQGITADFSLEGEKIDEPYGVGMFVWIPTKDHTAPKLDYVKVGVEALHCLLQDGKKVYIHCKNGHGRAPTFYAAYLILKKGVAPEKAVQLIKEKRNSIHLEYSQIDFLQSLV